MRLRKRQRTLYLICYNTCVGGTYVAQHTAGMKRVERLRVDHARSTIKTVVVSIIIIIITVTCTLQITFIGGKNDAGVWRGVRLGVKSHGKRLKQNSDKGRRDCLKDMSVHQCLRTDLLSNALVEPKTNFSDVS